MPTRPTPTLADRATLTRGSPDVNPFAGEGFPGDNFDIASFLRGGDLVRIEDAQTVSFAAAAAQPVASAPIDTPPGLEAAQNTPPVGVIAEVGTLPDRMIGTDGLLAAGSSALVAPVPDRALTLPGDLARVSSPDSAAVIPDAAIAPAANPVAGLQGGPLIVQLDPVRGVATPVADAPLPLVSATPTTPITSSSPGFALEWAPVLEPHGGAASAIVPLFDTLADPDDSLLSALGDLPILPPITPPNGDGLGA